MQHAVCWFGQRASAHARQERRLCCCDEVVVTTSASSLVELQDDCCGERCTCICCSALQAFQNVSVTNEDDEVMECSARKVHRSPAPRSFFHCGCQSKFLACVCGCYVPLSMCSAREWALLCVCMYVSLSLRHTFPIRQGPTHPPTPESI